MMQAPKERNQTFSLLQALLILMVIDDHTSTRIGLLSSIFPYNSFYMPLFVMISGYFYKERHVWENIKHKSRRILLPYILWNWVGNSIAFVLQSKNTVHWYRAWTLRRIAAMFITGPVSSIVGPGWFAIMLFHVSIGYGIIDAITRRIRLKMRDYALLIMLCGMGMLGLWICVHHYNNRAIITVLCRIVFYLQFYHMGRMFRMYWENWVLRQKKSIVCAICIAFNVICMCVFNKEIRFPSTSGMRSFSSWYLPLLTSVSGGLFWYEVANYAAPLIGKRKGIEWIAENTFTIMMVHLFFLNIPNFYVYFQALKGSARYTNFDIAAFQASAWYRYTPDVRLIAYFCGLCGSLLVVYGLVRLKERFQGRLTGAA